MATVGSFLETIQSECYAVRPPADVAVQWLQNRYATVLERAPYSFLQTETTFNTVAEITAGTVTLTLGSTTVTETTSNANGWSSSVEGRYFRRDGDDEFYLISTYTDANPDTLTLNRVYEDTSGTVLGYTIFQRLYTPATDIREIISITAINTAGKLQEVSQAELDAGFPNRPTLGEPTSWAVAGRDSSNNLRIELYPIPDTAKGMVVRYISETPSLANASTTILPQIDIRVLRAGWLSDYWRWVPLKRPEMSPVALSLYNTYETEFERRLGEILLREAQSMPTQRLKLSPSLTLHRWRRQNKWQPIGTEAVVEET